MGIFKPSVGGGTIKIGECKLIPNVTLFNSINHSNIATDNNGNFILKAKKISHFLFYLPEFVFEKSLKNNGKIIYFNLRFANTKYSGISPATLNIDVEEMQKIDNGANKVIDGVTYYQNRRNINYFPYYEYNGEDRDVGFECILFNYFIKE